MTEETLPPREAAIAGHAALVKDHQSRVGQALAAVAEMIAEEEDLYLATGWPKDLVDVRNVASTYAVKLNPPTAGVAPENLNASTEA